MDEEIVTFLTQVIQSDVSKSTAEQGSAMIKLVSRIESINDSCYLMAQFIQQAKSINMPFTEEMVNNLKLLFETIDPLLKRLEAALELKSPSINLDAERQYRDEIRETIEKLNIEHLKSIKKGIYKYKIGIIYCDAFTEQGVLADHCYHGLKYIDEMIRSK